MESGQQFRGAAAGRQPQNSKDRGESGGDQWKSQRINKRGTNANSSSAEKADRANPQPSVNRGTGASKTRSGLGGSRFLHVQDMETDEAEDLEAVIGDENEGRTEVDTAQKVQVVKEGKQKGKKESDKLEGREKEVVVVLSHLSISKEGAVIADVAAMSSVRGAVTINQRKKTKESKTLKDVMNKLDPRPVKMKPGHSGLKSLDGNAFREVGPSTGWVSYASKPSSSGIGLQNLEALSGSGTSTHSKPPDPGDTANPNKIPPGCPNYLGEGVEADDRITGDGDRAEQPAAQDMEDVEMEFGSAGSTGTH